MSEPAIRPLGLSDVLSMEAVHGACFDQPWSLDSFCQLMTLPTTGAFGAFVEEELIGFCLFSVVVDEVEILTIGVASHYQRLGVGSLLVGYLLGLLQGFSDTQKEKYICHLEVDEKNQAAIKLYDKFGFVPCGKRPQYYKNSKGEVSDALLMRIVIEIKY